jgi:hypothetical protein
MDIKQIRIDAKLLVGRMPNDTISWRVANEMLRILDAFDAMERNGWHLNQGRTWRHDEDVYESPGIAYWKVVAYPNGAAVGQEIVRAATPLAALLAAADKLKQEPRDGH